MRKNLVVNTRYFRLFPPDKYLGYAFEEYKADLDKSAFLLVDVYGLGFHPEDPVPTWKEGEHDKRDRPGLAWKGSVEYEAKIVKDSLLPALNAAREIGMKVIYLNNSAPKIGLISSEFGKLLHRQLKVD